MGNVQTSWEPLLTPEEASAYLRCHEKTAIRYARQGIIPALRLGGKLWRFRKSDLAQWAAATVPDVPLAVESQHDVGLFSRSAWGR